MMVVDGRVMEPGQWSVAGQEAGRSRVESGGGPEEAFSTSCQAVLWATGELRDARAWNGDGLDGRGRGHWQARRAGRRGLDTRQRSQRSVYSQSMLKTPSIWVGGGGVVLGGEGGQVWVVVRVVEFPYGRGLQSSSQRPAR